ncbi:MAG: hypothetical protein K8J08_16770 [Thermoanaerobaculia bacterium]|nr:hypothetical protein [Thermoanaerobaculia bacterium]
MIVGAAEPSSRLDTRKSRTTATRKSIPRLVLSGVLLLAHCLSAKAQVDPEVGPNDFQLSFSEVSNQHNGTGYSPDRREYLASWREWDYQDIVVQRLDHLGAPIGDPMATGLGYTDDSIVVTHDSVNDRFLVVADLGGAIAGVLVDSTGLVGNPFPITGQTSTSFDVVFNPDLQEYVVCRFQVSLPGIRLRRVTANGEVIGLEDQWIGILSSNDRPYPSITYNSIEQEYLIAEHHQYDNGGDEVFAWRLDPTLTLLEVDVISSISSSNQGARGVDVAHNSLDNEYLVVWRHGQGDTATDGDEVYGQRLGSEGQEIGFDDFKISTMGRPGVSEANASSPRIHFNPSRGRYLVVWSGDDFTSNMVDDEFEVFGQYLNHDGGLLAPGNFRLSDYGPNGNEDYDAYYPSSAYNPNRDEFLILFTGVEAFPSSQRHVYGQRIYGAPTIFSDGFETGNASHWSSSSPLAEP